MAELENHCACYNVTVVPLNDMSVVNMEVREVTVDISFKVDGKAARSTDGASSITVSGLTNKLNIAKGEVLRRCNNEVTTDMTRKEVQAGAMKVNEPNDVASAKSSSSSSKGANGQKGKGRGKQAKGRS